MFSLMLLPIYVEILTWLGVPKATHDVQFGFPSCWSGLKSKIRIGKSGGLAKNS